MEEKEINNIITCGIRWGSGNPSFAELLLDNNIAILYAKKRGSSHFLNADKNDLIALKDGHGIIALGRFEKRQQDITWRKAIENYIDNVNGKYTDKEIIELSEKYGFDLEAPILLIEVEEWIMMNPPIYYHIRQSTVIIKQNHVIKECNDRFKQSQLDTEQYNDRLSTQDINQKKVIEYHINITNALIQDSIMSTEKKDKVELLNQALIEIQHVLDIEPKNQKAGLLQQKINKLLLENNDRKAVQNKIGELFDRKARKLREANICYISLFISTVLILIGGLIFYMIKNPDTDQNIVALIVTKITTMSTIIVGIFWIAKFFNRRIHENVHLIEEYEFRALLFESCQYINVLEGYDEKQYLEKVIEVASSKINFNSKKGDNIPIEFLEKLNLMKNISNLSEKN